MVVCLFNLAGAFAGEASVEHIVLVASDSDYRPALEYILQRGPASLRLWVLADGRPRQEGAEAHGVDGGGQMRAGYRSWLRDTPRAGILSLPRTMEALGRKSGKTVLRTPQHFVQLGRAFRSSSSGMSSVVAGWDNILPQGVAAGGVGVETVPHILEVLTAALEEQTAQSGEVVLCASRVLLVDCD